jgi:hypothetical protein
MENNDDILTTETTEIKQLIDRVPSGRSRRSRQSVCACRSEEETSG